MPEQSPSDRSQFWGEIKPIFLKWEKLRLVYNLVLLVVLLASLPGSGRLLLHMKALDLFSMLLSWLLCGVGANILYMAGPVVESYARWLGYQNRWITIALFTGGVLVSIPLVIFCAIYYLLGPTLLQN